MSQKTWVIETFPRVQQDSHGLVKPLWSHQLAMLHRCKSIEASGTHMAVLRSPAGSGKTAVMLALITSDKISKTAKRGINLAVVPQGIYTQWQEAIEQFAGDTIKYKLFVDYADVLELYYTSEGLEHMDLLLTTPAYYDSIRKACTEANLSFKRVFLDEVDGISWFLQDYKKHRNDISATVIWNVSASFSPSLLPNMSEEDIVKVTCDCSPSFIHSSLQLPPPIKTIIPCQDVCLEHVLRYVCTQERMYSMNAGDFSWLQPISRPMHIRSSQEAVKVMLQNAIDLIELNQTLHKDLSKKRPMNRAVVRDMERAAATIKKQQEIMETIRLRLDMLKKLTIDSKIKTKDETVLALLQGKTRTIVFSSYQQALSRLAGQLETAGIKFGQLDGGNIPAIDKTVALFKSGDLQILLLQCVVVWKGNES